MKGTYGRQSHAQTRKERDWVGLTLWYALLIWQNRQWRKGR